MTRSQHDSSQPPPKRRTPLWLIIAATAIVTILIVVGINALSDKEETAADTPTTEQPVEPAKDDIEPSADSDEPLVYSPEDPFLISVPFNPQLLDEIAEREQAIRDGYVPGTVYSPTDPLMVEVKTLTEQLEEQYYYANIYRPENPTVEEFRITFVEVSWQTLGYYKNLYLVGTGSTSENLRDISADITEKRAWVSEHAGYYQYAPSE